MFILFYFFILNFVKNNLLIVIYIYIYTYRYIYFVLIKYNMTTIASQKVNGHSENYLFYIFFSYLINYKNFNLKIFAMKI
jgi:hypothetical protein